MVMIRACQARLKLNIFLIDIFFVPVVLCRMHTTKEQRTHFVFTLVPLGCWIEIKHSMLEIITIFVLNHMCSHQWKCIFSIKLHATTIYTIKTHNYCMCFFFSVGVKFHNIK